MVTSLFSSFFQEECYRLSANDVVFWGAVLPFLFIFADQPVCRPGQKTMYGVAKGETTQVKCNSDAIPPVLHFFHSKKQLGNNNII